MLTMRRFFPILLLSFVLIACSNQPTQTAAPVPEITATITLVPATATPTPEPVALRVNGEVVLLADYQAELERLQAAARELNKTLTPEEERQLVLDALISQALLVQSAQKDGISVSDADVQAHLAELTAQMGGAEILAGWMAANGYTEASLNFSLKQAMLAAAARDAVIAQAPESGEQVHARQILLLDEKTANQVWQQLQSGADFATQAYIYDPLAGGDLGWFPRGYLTQPDVENAAFALQPGEYSPVIKTSFGYHIVMVMERESDRKLPADARRTLQRALLAQWLEQQRGQSTIEILVP